MTEAVVLYTTWPDEESAEAFAAEAVADRLAACANILGPMRSVYRWQGAVDRAAEVPMLLKTARARAAALIDRLNARHPYELPCAVALQIDAAASSPDFLAWIAAESGPPAGDADERP
jgi:periplasmic divalent cation tolerance protein